MGVKGFNTSVSGYMPSPDSQNCRRQVIFTADDFGLSPLLNQAVALAHQNGLLKCASLMPGAPAAAPALNLARQLPEICLGIHLTLIQGWAVLPPPALPQLVDAAGRFPQNPVLTGWQYFASPGLLREIRRELRAQIETVLGAGISVWYLNSHLNLHLHPRLAPMVVELAREYGIPALRLAREDWPATLKVAPKGLFPKVALGLIFAILSRRARRLAEAAGLVVNDYLFGLTHHGRLTEEHLITLIPRLRPGITEFCLHPAVGVDPMLAAANATYLRDREFLALLSPRLREVLKAHGVEVISYRELANQDLT